MMTTATAVWLLDCLIYAAPDDAHTLADELLLEVVPPEVADAYRRVMAHHPGQFE